MTLAELRTKEVIDVHDGKRLGRVMDIEFCTADSRVTALVVPGHLSLAQLVEKMSVVPSSILGIEGGCLKVGGRADLAIVDPDEQWVVDPAQFHSRARNTPFTGMTLTGRVKATVCGGKITFQA